MSEKNAAAISRREFARRAAMAAAVASVAPAGMVRGELVPGAAQTLQPGTPSGAPGAPRSMFADLPKLTPESQAEADARLQAILAVYGARFSEEQKTDLRRLCILAQGPLDRLRTYPVENADGPGVYLKPLFEREKKPKTVPPAQPAAKTSGATRKP